MRVYVAGRSKALRLYELRFAANWFLSQLLSKRIRRRIVLKFNIETAKGLYGSCEPVKNFRQPKQFKVLLDPNMSRNMSLRVLAHEMAHVKQYVKEELKDYKFKSHSKWKNSRLIQETADNYWNLPWEKEALRLEEELLTAYKAFLKANPEALKRSRKKRLR